LIEGTDDAVQLVFADSWIQDVRFADGTVWDYETVYQKGLMGTSGANYVVSSAASSPQGLVTQSGAADRQADDNNPRSIEGGSGNDLLIGEVAADTFVFRGDLGRDIMAGDAARSDLVFGHGVLGAAASAFVVAAASGSNVWMPIDADSSVFLPDEMLSRLHAGDFHIV
jgi:hypothetical protein